MSLSPDRMRRHLRILWRRRAQPEAAAQLRMLRRRIATVTGAILLGIVALLFAEIADSAHELFLSVAGSWPWLPVLLTPAVFAGVVYATRRWAAEASGSGIPQVIAAGRTSDRVLADRMVSLYTAGKKLVLTVVMLLAGGSVGREGPTVQVSAAIMVWIHKLLRVPITAGVLIAGGAAGVAAAFNTPLAGVAFAIEELAAAYEQRIAVLVMGAVMISGLVSLGLAGDYVYFGEMGQTLPLHTVLMATPIAGIFGGAMGGLFSRLVLRFSRATSGFFGLSRKRPVLFAAACGLIVALLGIATAGSTWGTGYATTRDLVEGGDISLWFGPAKLLATLATTLSGAPGGIFAPSLAVGAGIGNFLKELFPNDAAGAIILLGMAAYFVGVIRAPFTAVIILSETTASRGMILPMFATALIADAVSALVCRERLYSALARGFLARSDPPVDLKH
ncbi:chloride channel protein [Sphingosinithalassobacter portus]|uniref:chloride channel protein n=1 Tax=Stakelama portus TaxID=2676234 RepID=UPI000D6E4A50